MNKINAWLYNFMRGRYGFDQLGRTLSVCFITLWIFSIIFGVSANLFGRWAAWASSMLNWAGLIVLVVMVFRIMSRNTTKRSAENEAYLNWRSRRKNRKNSSSKDISSKKNKKNTKDYKYLTCAFCGQQMRVPKGKGKIAVKCPSCGEKTIVKS